MSSKRRFFLIFAILVLMTQPVLARDTPVEEPDTRGYFANMGYNLSRGLRNILASPFEIPKTMGEYHGKEGRPVIRHMAGFSDGLFRGLQRLGSGFFDFVAAIIPGQQASYPPNDSSETLF